MVLFKNYMACKSQMTSYTFVKYRSEKRLAEVFLGPH